MSSFGLDGLPYEVLDYICGYLHEQHQPSLRTLALVSKNCRRVASTWIFRTLRFEIRTVDQLRQDVHRYLGILSRIECLEYARRIEVRGFLPPTRTSEAPVVYDELAGRASDQRDYKDELFGDPKVHWSNIQGRLEVGEEEDGSWQPLGELIHALPRLTDLVFDCSNQFPSRLLSSLHQYQPHCRLHLKQFRVPSLVRYPPDPYEMRLATSSCLYSIECRFGHDGDPHENIVHNLVGGLAPNLKHVLVARPAPYSYGHVPSIPHHEIKPSLTAPTPDGIPGVPSETSRASLESLSLTGRWQLLERWYDFTDFTSLRYLNLSRIDSDSLRWATLTGLFPRLEELQIELFHRWVDHETLLLESFSDAATCFFASLPPLQALTISGYVEPEIFKGILERHGQTLRKLRLGQFSMMAASNINHAQKAICHTPWHLTQVLESCPILGELALCLMRTMSNKKEVELYRILGMFPRLRDLSLTLQVTTPYITRRSMETPSDPSFDDFDNEIFGEEDTGPRKGHMKIGLLNAAVDESLVRSIWGVITRREASAPLQTLKLFTTREEWPHPAWNFHGWSANEQQSVVVEHIRRSYLVQRSVRDDNHSISVRELGRDAREAKERVYQMQGRSPDMILEVFRRAWPAKEGSSGWRDDWASIPLDLSDIDQPLPLGELRRVPDWGMYRCWRD